MNKNSKNEKLGENEKNDKSHPSVTIDDLIKEAIKKRRGEEKLRKLFDEVDEDSSGSINLDEFVRAYTNVDDSLSRDQLRTIFYEADYDGSGELDFEEFSQLAKLPEKDILSVLEATNRDENGLVNVEQSTESYF
eukprot:12423698-Ditylum_brightwellii.AAC.1